MRSRNITKRVNSIIAMTMCFVTLTACAANPQRDIVTSKNDGSFEANVIQQATGSVDERVLHSETFTSTDGTAEYTISIDQEILSNALPVAKVVPHILTGAEVQKVATAVFGDVTFYDHGRSDDPQFTKEQLQEKIQLYTQYANEEALKELYGPENYDASRIDHYKSLIQKYTVAMETAPAENPNNLCDWKFRSDSNYYDPSYGDNVIFANLEYNDIQYHILAEIRDKKDYKISRIDIMVGDNYMEMLPIDAPWITLCRTEEPTDDQIADIKKRAQVILDQMDLGDWLVSDVEIQTQYRGDIPQYEVVVSAAPVIHGTQVLAGQPNQSLTSEDANAPHYFNSIAQFSFSAKGDLIYLHLISPVDVTEVVNEGVATLSFDDLIGAAKNHLSLFGVYEGWGVSGDYIAWSQEMSGEQWVCKAQVDDIRYGLARVTVPDTDFCYYYVPALVFKGTAEYYGQKTGTLYESTESGTVDMVWVNAVDGSIIGEE